MSDKNIKVRGIVTIVIVAVALFFLMPSITQKLPSVWKDNTDKIHLGLDLQGGMHLVMEVETEKAVESSMERISNDLKDLLMEKRVRFKRLSREDGAVTTLELPNKEAGARFRKILKDNFPNLDIKSSEIVNGSEKVYLKIRDKQVAAIEKFAVEQSLETIRNRVDQFGVSEPEIIPQGKDRILIQLPGVKDPQRAINLIGKTALLEFKLLDEEHSLDEALKGNVPSGDIIAYGYRVESETGRRAKIPYLLKRKTLLTGESLEDAKVSISDRFGEAYVSLKFDSQGAKDFDRITAANVKKRLAIVLDGVVHSAPVIQERISGGNAQITGSFTMNEAHDLAIVLRAGALPAPVRILEQRTVGPTREYCP